MNTTTTMEKITPKQAEIYLGYLYERQRPIRSTHVQFLAAQMEKGRFDPTAQIAFAIENGSPKLINGNHTLRAIVEADTTLQLNVIRHETTSPDQTASLYVHYDIGVSRTTIDSMRVFQMAENTGLPPATVNKLAAALRYISQGFPRSKKRTPSEDLKSLIEDWNVEALVFTDSISPCDGEIRKRMMTTAPFAFFLILLRYAGSKGVDFVSQVAKDDRLERDDPRKALQKYLLDTKRISRSSTYPKDHIIMRGCAKAWNKYFDGLSLLRLDVSEKDTEKPFTIKGTPYRLIS